VAERVAIVGAGPTGLFCACELALAGVPVCLYEQLPARRPGIRATAIHARTLEAFDMRGLVDVFLAGANRRVKAHYGGGDLWLDRLHSRFNYMINVPQGFTEDILERRARTLGAEILRERRVAAVRQDAESVVLDMDGPQGRTTERARVLVAADGARSTVRTALGMAFPGVPSRYSSFIAEVSFARAPQALDRFRKDSGSVSLAQYEPKWWRVVVTLPRSKHVETEVEPTIDELKEALLSVFGTDYGIREVRLISRFGDAARILDRYREGRVLFAGDAAHIHYPAGGQGMNTGLQDAFNLGWKLAAVMQGRAPDALLDSYHDERRPVGVGVVADTQAQTELMMTFGDDPSTRQELRRLVLEELLPLPPVTDFLADRIAGLAVRYPAATGAHGDWNGRRVPDFDLVLRDGTRTRLFEHLRAGTFVLLDFATTDVRDGGELPLRTKILPVQSCADPAGGPAPGGTASSLLVRPDGYGATGAFR
jgi:2-polyprenyl-6-methoxyphenol hydroxylase-like FAD-dependent oxidoreductase